MRPSTRNALLLAIGLAILTAELATTIPVREAGPGLAASALDLLPSPSLPRGHDALGLVAAGMAPAGLAPARSEAPWGRPASLLPDPATLSTMPWINQLRRESLVRRARHSLAGETLDL